MSVLVSLTLLIFCGYESSLCSLEHINNHQDPEHLILTTDRIFTDTTELTEEDLVDHDVIHCQKDASNGHRGDIPMTEMICPPFLVENITTSIFTFSMELAKVTYQNSATDNIVIPSSNVALSLKMLGYGADDHTKIAIYKMIHFPYFVFIDSAVIKEDIDDSLMLLDRNLTDFKIQMDVTWGSVSKDDLNPGFVNDTESRFHKKNRSLDLPSFHSQVIVQLDVSGVVKDLFKISTAFDAYWQSPFDPEETKDNIMTQTNSFSHGKLESLDVEFIELPYKVEHPDSSNASMLVFCPMSGSIERVVKNLNNITYEKLKKNSQKDIIELTIPKITFNSSITFDGSHDKLPFYKIFGTEHISNGVPAFADFNIILNNTSKIGSIQTFTTFVLNEQGSSMGNKQNKAKSSELSSSLKFEVKPPFIGLIIVNGTIVFNFIIKDID